MKIRMKTNSCGPNPDFNFQTGQIRDVSPEEADYWVKQGVAETLEPFTPVKGIGKPEKAVVAPKEAAVGQPSASVGWGKGEK